MTTFLWALDLRNYRWLFIKDRNDLKNNYNWKLIGKQQHFLKILVSFCYSNYFVVSALFLFYSWYLSCMYTIYNFFFQLPRILSGCREVEPLCNTNCASVEAPKSNQQNTKWVKVHICLLTTSVLPWNIIWRNIHIQFDLIWSSQL